LLFIVGHVVDPYSLFVLFSPFYAIKHCESLPVQAVTLFAAARFVWKNHCYHTIIDCRQQIGLPG
jgi:hypothetical protein